MSRAYREDELLGAAVVDSEGYIYGRLDKIEIGEDKVSLVVFEYRPDTRDEVDLEALKRALRVTVEPEVAASSSSGVSSAQLLDRKVRREFGLDSRSELGVDHYVRYAERYGVKVPKRKVAAERKELKGVVDLNEVAAMRVSSVSDLSGVTRPTKIVFLNQPREASFRKIPVQGAIPFKDTSSVKDKMALDAEGFVLGHVDSVILFRGTPGIRVYTTRIAEYVDLKKVESYIRETGYGAHLLNSVRQQFPNREKMRLDEVEALAQRYRVQLPFLGGAISEEVVRDVVMDVPWEEIKKVGDVVVLKQTLPELRSKGYVFR